MGVRRGAATCVGLGLWLAQISCQILAPSAPLQPPTLNPDLVARGALLFLDPALSVDGRRSCATCHPGGGSDGRVYRDGEAVLVGTPGSRNTPSLRGVWQTAPYLWDGSLATVEAAIGRMLAVEMGGGSVSEIDLRALETYVLSISRFDRGRIEQDGTPVESSGLAARLGFELFGRIECARCHPPPSFARRRPSNVGTGQVLDPPTLLGLKHSAPYGHDGRWPSVEAALRAKLEHAGVELSERELLDLLAYLDLL